jgi:ABC-2 type transport system ATP-binding protein
MSSPLLYLDAVRRKAGNREVLAGLTLRVDRGDALGLVGANGSGKTTLLRLMVGLLEPSGGSLSMGGMSIRHALRKFRIGFFGGWSTLPPTVTAAAWCRLSAASTAHHSYSWLGRKLGRLSPGLRQQAGLLAVLGQPQPDLIVLDEPWDSLDLEACRWLTTLLQRHHAAGVTLIITSHRVQELCGVCSRTAFLSNGTLHEPEGTRSPHTPESILAAYDRLAVH